MAAKGHENVIGGSHGGHLGYRNGTIFAITNRHVDPMPPIKFQLSPTFRPGGDVVKSLGYRSGMSIAIQDIHVSPIYPIKC